MKHDRRNVAVTGFGLVSPIGFREPAFWSSLLEGRDGMGPVRFMDVSEYRTRNGAEIPDAVLQEELAQKDWKPMDRVIDMALLATDQALTMAEVDDAAKARTATLIGTCHGPTQIVEDVYSRYNARGRQGTRPTSIPRGMMNAVPSQVSMRFGLKGPNYMIASACSSSTNAIGLGFRMVRDGYADTVLCGGSDSSFTPTLYACWDRLGVMSKREDPHTACRPFAQDRDGFLLGEGAGMLVLEALDRAQDRGVPIYGLVCGFGETSDAIHLTRPSEAGQTTAILNAMDDAAIDAAALAFVNAHGTATHWNDDCESRSIRSALGQRAKSTPVVSNKSFFGHTLGAAGALETIATLLSLRAGRLPGNLNLTDPDPACAIRLPGGDPQNIESPYALKNSFGFGGGNASLVLRRYGD